ncbi:DNA polymerase III subunit gamma/tau [Candidatus Pelagibacter communis]|uniref:DNA polymerase III subunit gamma/tau n=1 Tax=Pelagibacter ubique TaxID=198252 RepID=UPI00094DCCFB|nr:DNA polymerase III subunit gamma/tau [Candidatus Pelagibacter ubique]
MSTNKTVLAIKYRPQVFDELVGQSIIVETIRKSISLNKIPNAFLFTGIRGVGKTTIARILAKALNCADPKKNNCLNNCCSNCSQISESRHIDVLEMDAASKTGVDDVRDLIEFSRYGPTSSKYKIFIIDEVHMLSKQAFNALLKTLEEPPEYLKFIFATTEVNKIPVTVLSRCQRFDLLRISFDELLTFLKKVTLLEKKELDEEILKLVVKISEGSVRDSLSLLDRVFLSDNDNGKKLNLKSVQKIFGYFGKGYLLDLIIEIFKGNEKKVLELYKNIYNQGVEPKLFINDFLEIIYYLKNNQNIDNLSSSLDFTDSDFERIKNLSNSVDNRSLLLFWEYSVNILSEINLVSNQHLAVEMFLIRLMYLKKEVLGTSDNSILSNDGNKNKDQINENYVKNLYKDINNNKTIDQIKFSSQEEEKISIDDKKISNKTEINSFSDLISVCVSKKEIELKYELENNVNLISFKNNNIEISFNDNLNKNFIKNLTTKLLNWTGERWIITLSKKTGLKTMKEMEVQNNNNKLDDLKNSELFKEAINLFPDLEIVNIKDIKEDSSD